MDQVLPGTFYWRRSGFCADSACVEIALVGARIAVRDSKDVSGPVLFYTGEEWRAFIDGVRSGHFDDLYGAVE